MPDLPCVLFLVCVPLTLQAYFCPLLEFRRLNIVGPRLDS